MNVWNVGRMLGRWGECLGGGCLGGGRCLGGGEDVWEKDVWEKDVWEKDVWEKDVWEVGRIPGDGDGVKEVKKMKHERGWTESLWEERRCGAIRTREYLS